MSVGRARAPCRIAHSRLPACRESSRAMRYRTRVGSMQAKGESDRSGARLSAIVSTSADMHASGHVARGGDTRIHRSTATKCCRRSQRCTRCGRCGRQRRSRRSSSLPSLRTSSVNELPAKPRSPGVSSSSESSSPPGRRRRCCPSPTPSADRATAGRSCPEDRRDRGRPLRRAAGRGGSGWTWPWHFSCSGVSRLVQDYPRIGVSEAAKTRASCRLSRTARVRSCRYEERDQRRRLERTPGATRATRACATARG